MAKGSGSSGSRGGSSRGGGSGSSRGSASGSGSTSGGRPSGGSSNSKMWNQPATARQIAALKANGNFDGKFYSKGRAGQAIGESARAAGAVPGRAGSTQRRPSSIVGTNELAGLAELVAQMRPVLGDAEPAGEQVVLGQVVERERLDARRDRTPVGDPGGVLSIDFLARLEARHLDGYRAHHTYGSAKGLRDETTAWNDLKLQVAKQISEAIAALVAVLRDAPRDAVPAPREAARALLAQAVHPDLEESHLWNYLSQHTYGSGDGLRGEVRGWLDNRISIASTNAHGLIELARLRAKGGPEPEVSTRAAYAPLPRPYPLPGRPRPRRRVVRTRPGPPALVAAGPFRRAQSRASMRRARMSGSGRECVAGCTSRSCASLTAVLELRMSLNTFVSVRRSTFARSERTSEGRPSWNWFRRTLA